MSKLENFITTRNNLARKVRALEEELRRSCDAELLNMIRLTSRCAGSTKSQAEVIYLSCRSELDASRQDHRNFKFNANALSNALAAAERMSDGDAKSVLGVVTQYVKTLEDGGLVSASTIKLLDNFQGRLVPLLADRLLFDAGKDVESGSTSETEDPALPGRPLGVEQTNSFQRSVMNG